MTADAARWITESTPTVFFRASLGVTISQQLVMDAFSHDLVTRPLSPPSCRTIGLAFARTTNSVVAQTLLAYMQQRLA